MSYGEDYYYMEAMNKHIMNERDKLIFKNAVISIIFGIGIYMLVKYVTSDTNLAMHHFYLQKSPFLMQMANRYWYKTDKYEEKNKDIIDDDGLWDKEKLAKTVNKAHDFNRHESHNIPPSLMRNKMTSTKQT